MESKQERDNSELIRNDITSGKTSDKVHVSAPAAAPFNMYDEAGGAPKIPQKIHVDRRQETTSVPLSEASKKDLGIRNAPMTVHISFAIPVVLIIVAALLLWST